MSFKYAFPNFLNQPANLRSMGQGDNRQLQNKKNMVMFPV